MGMGKPTPTLLFFLQISGVIANLLILVEASNAKAINSSGGKLLVFGDSYADTGNLPKIFSPSWRQPYGLTFPKRPAGRFSDGRIFTDYFASFVGTKSPIPYKYRVYGHRLIRYGMNFAVGGSGVFEATSAPLNDSLSVQISLLKEQVAEGVFSDLDLHHSTALVLLAGNDYLHYQDSGGTMEGLRTFTPELIEKLKLELKRLGDMGLKNVAVANLHPIGCLPSFTTSSSNKECNSSVNLAVIYHNNLLDRAVTELNANTTNPNLPFIVINLYDAFMSVINQGLRKWNNNNNNVLRPCCEAESSDYSCGYEDLSGVKKYKVCSDPNTAFYWDNSHPTQAGWEAIFSALRPSLSILLTPTT